MRYTTLGRTGLKVSIVGFGASGNFGAMTGDREEQAGALIRQALDLGIDLIDTAANYGHSEEILGRAIKGVPREEYTLNSKYFPINADGCVLRKCEVRASVDRSLSRLRCGHLDVLQIHGVRPEHYGGIVSNHLEELNALRQEGKFRFLGITETIRFDPRHETLSQSLEDGHFDTAMVAYSLLSPTPENVVLPQSAHANVGVIAMTAVRRALSQPEFLRDLIRRAGEAGRLPAGEVDADRPLNWLLSSDTPSLAAAGYKYVLAHPAVCSVLSGTTDPHHLEENVRAALGPPLPPEHFNRLRDLFMPSSDSEAWSTFDL